MKKLISSVLVLCLMLVFVPVEVFAATIQRGTTGSCSWRQDGTVLTIYNDNLYGPYGKNSSFMASYDSGSVYRPLTRPWSENITKVNISDAENVGAFAFHQFKSLETVNINVRGDNVKRIDSYAFYGCSNLSRMIIPNSVTKIGAEAFYNTGIYNDESNWEDGALYISNCLVNVKKDNIKDDFCIKNGTRVIADKAFSGCTNLASITVPDSIENLGMYTFEKCEIRELNISKGAKKVTSKMVMHGVTLEVVNIPDGVMDIGDYAFHDCRGLTSVTIPNSVTSIGNNAFDGCTSLTNITIPYGVTSIGKNTFAYCDLTSITIPDSVTSIGDEAFLKCSRLTSVVLPNSVTSIGKLAFWDCTGLTSITIPNSVTSIDKNAFWGCDKSRLTIYTDDISSVAYTYAKANGYRCVVLVDQAENLQFSVTGDTLEIIGSGKMLNYNLFTSTPWYAEKDNITRIVIDSRITDVGTYSFYGFDNLKAVVTENPDLVFHQYALNNTNTALTVYSYTGGMLEQYCSDNGLCFVVPLDTPTLLGVTEKTITVKAESGLEYSLDKESWQTDGVFTGLSPVTEYTVYVRRKGGYTPIEGTPLKVKTTKRVIAAPTAPAIQAYDTTTVTLKPMTGYEYSKDGITWQQSNVFTGIVSNRIYSFRQRLAETDTDFASESSAPLYYAMPSKPEILSVGATTLTVKAVEGFEYSLDKITWQKDPYFSALIYGMEYTVYQRIAKVDNADTYAVISTGTTVLINGSDKKTPAAPSAPVVESKTSDTVTLKKTAGYEYRMDSGAWQKSPVFTGLSPNSTHRFYQRVAETDTTYASESSTALTVQLDPPFTRGDLDGDEEISDWDGVLLARYLAGWNVNISNADALDIDGDGEITDWDGVLLDRYLAGWDIKIS